MDKIAKAIAQFCSFVSTASIVAITIIMVLQVFCRMILGNPLSWSDEFAAYFLVWLALFGAVTAIYEHKHMAIDALISRLKGKTVHIVAIIANLCTLVFILVVLWYAIPLTLSVVGKYAISLQVSKALIYSALPVTSACSVILLVDAVVKECKKLMTKEEAK